MAEDDKLDHEAVTLAAADEVAAHHQFVQDVLESWEGDEAKRYNAVFVFMQGVDITLHEVFNKMKNAVLSECCQVGFMTNITWSFTLQRDLPRGVDGSD